MMNHMANNSDQNEEKRLLEESKKAKATYEVVPTFALEQLLQHADALNNELDSYRPLPEKEHIWSALQEKLISEWTYHSNAIEGSTLTLGETIFFLQYGLTAEGKPLKDFLDVRNHADAIGLLYEFVKEDRNLSEAFIKEINALLLLGVTSTPAIDQFGMRSRKPATPGKYKISANTVLQTDGTIHEYVPPVQVSSEMEYLCNWVNTQINILHPVITGAIAHYNMVRIHPFDDGNGRGARILMNLILLKRKYPPAIIKIEERRKYIKAHIAGDEGDLNPFIEFIAKSSIATQEMMLQILKSNGTKK
jgi:Fic family protein